MSKNGPSPKKFCHPVLVIAMTFVLLLLGSGIGSIVSVAVAVASGAGEQDIFIIFAYLPFIGIIAATLLYTFFTRRDLFKAYWAGSFPKNMLLLAAGLVTGFLMNGISILPAILHGDLKLGAGSITPFWFVVSFLLVLIQSSAEEILFRGYTFSHIENRYGFWPGLITSAVLFAATHLGNDGIQLNAIIDLLLISLFYVFCVRITGNLFFVMAHHAAWNFTQNFIWGLPNSGLPAVRSLCQIQSAQKSIFYDPVFGIEGTIPVLLLLAVCSLLCYFWMRRRLASEKSEQNI